MTNIAEVVPDVVTIDELAEWYASRLPQFQALASAMRKAERRLTEYVRDMGPLATASGRLEITPDGFDYDEDAIAEAFPAVLKHRVVTLQFDTVEKAERALSLVYEEVPDVGLVATKTSIDKLACARIERAGGQAGERMKALRRPRGRLGVTR